LLPVRQANDAVKSGSNLLGAGEVEFIENVQRASPAVAGGVGAARGVVVVAEVGEHIGFVVPVVETADLLNSQRYELEYAISVAPLS
jgi:hypothetical protein